MELKTNNITDLANRYINNTNRHIFLTGKAGTGKTTFLRQLVSSTVKKTAVAAPTGIAAINAGGVTLHSLLQLPFGVFVPDQNYNSSDFVNTPRTVLSGFRLNKSKRKLLQELELLIIDEVSMLRADLLDCIDTVLRHARRKKNLPFGGLQILFIGDLLQLPPVVKDQELVHLNRYYDTSYFFSAHALTNYPPVYLELDKIYRQEDNRFVDLLNRFRNNQVTTEDVQYLNSNHFENIDHENLSDDHVRITTHNQKADTINANALNKLTTKPKTFKADIVGDFPESMYPVNPELELKIGAQVMFTKNDGEERRYFNGKIGTVTDITEDLIEVTCPDDDLPISVSQYDWHNIRYTLNKETNEVDEKIIGSFKQYPLKLAWAITVHKSQGLTFDKAILDLSDAFAPGQVYVALSRLRSLDGLVLSSPISNQMISNDTVLTSYSSNKPNLEQLEEQIKRDFKDFLRLHTSDSFDFSSLMYLMKEHLKSFEKIEGESKKLAYRQWTSELFDEIQKLGNTSDTFIRQVRQIAATEGDIIPTLLERVRKAKEYFEPLLHDIQKKIGQQIDSLKVKTGVKTYTNELIELEATVYSQIRNLNKAYQFIKETSNGNLLTREKLTSGKQLEERKEALKKIKEKVKKKPTHEISYELYKEGLSLEEIADKRGLVQNTIAGHMCYYVASGEVNVEDFVDKEKISNILTVAETIKSLKLTEIKEKLGEEYSFGDIKFALAFKESQGI
ncbi:helix-turn-helix domain-containing protein [Marinigracilibium pacificum]|uniref:AAA family ATPase n=1 Tax=Marinigracilibium pacificum TaxID=2729599 RepID=A0A848IWY9_9BACT|nr:helix-turn-helix domain-containing protein [Marinigracilibium pacificum]NMM47801.1 AAA family ATPase [Marinigracilibium pacificum]